MVVATSDGQLFNSDYEFHAEHYQVPSDIPSYDPNQDPDVEQEAFKNQSIFEVLGHRDIVDKDTNRPTTDVDKNMPNYATEHEQYLGEGDQGNISTPKQSNTFYPSPMNNIQKTGLAGEVHPIEIEGLLTQHAQGKITNQQLKQSLPDGWSVNLRGKYGPYRLISPTGREHFIDG